MDAEEVQNSTDFNPTFEDEDSDTTENDETGCQSGRSRYMLPRRKLTSVEELEWMKPLLDKLWPKIDSALHKIMKETVEPKIQDKLPFALKGLTFKKFTLGKTTPSVGPITIWDAPCLKDDIDHRGLELHIEVELKTKNLDVELAIGALTAGVKECTIKGTLVVRLDPLLDHSPILGGLVIYFLDPPVLDLDFTQLASMAELELSERGLTRIFEKLIANRLVLPNVWFRPFLKDEDIVDTATLRDPKPVGVLRVTVIEGSKLYGNDFHLFSKATSDPYVRIRLADDEWQSCKREETCNPKWLTDPETIGSEQISPDEVQHDFLVYDVGQTLRMEVFDWNQIMEHVLIGRTKPMTVQEALSRSRKPMELFDSKEKQDRGHLVVQFDWLKVTSGYLDDDYACMVRIKFDEVYVPDDIDFTSAKIQVKLQDGKLKNTPFTSPPNTTVTFAESPSDKRLDVEYVMCFGVAKEAAMTEPLQISLIAQQDQVHRERTLAVGRINLEEVMNEPDKNKEWIDEPLILERPPPEDGNVLPDFFTSRGEAPQEAAPVRAEVTVSVMGLQPVATKAALTHMRKRCQQPPEDFRVTRRNSSLSKWEQPFVGRDQTKCTGSVESLDWFNAFFGRLWPKIAKYVQKLMEDQEGNVTQKMQAAVPKLLKGMYFNKFKLGTKTPVFGPIKIGEAPERWGKEPGKDANQGSEIRLGVKLDSESQIELTVMAVKVGIHRLQVRGEIAIRFEPLLGQTPVIGGLVMCFLNPPKLAMEYKHFAQLVGNTTLEPMVRGAIDRAIAKALVMPNVISVPIGSEEKGVDRSLLRHPRPLGIVRVRAKSATGLPDGHLHLFSKQNIDAYVRVRVADDEWHSSMAEGSSPVWTAADHHCFWYYDIRQTIHIEVMDKGRFNPQHTIGQAKPLLVKDAVENSGAAIELFAPVQGLDEIGDESCGSVDCEFELLQPRPGLRPQCELCMLRVKIDKIYVAEEFPEPIALRARFSDAEKMTSFVTRAVRTDKDAKDAKDDRKASKASRQDSRDPSKPPLRRIGTLLPEEGFEKQPVTLGVDSVLHLLLRQEDLKTHNLELELVDKKRKVFASKDIELKQLIDRKVFRRMWGSEKQPPLNLRGEGGKCQAELEVQISGLDVQQVRAKRAPPRFNPDFIVSQPRCLCSRCKLKRESWFLLAFAANALVEGVACLIAALSGFILVFAINVFGPRHRQKVLSDEADEDEVVPTNIPATLYEGGETTRSSKERASPILVRERPVSMAEPRSPTFDLTPTTRTWTKDRDRGRANTAK